MAEGGGGWGHRQNERWHGDGGRGEQVGRGGGRGGGGYGGGGYGGGGGRGGGYGGGGRGGRYGGGRGGGHGGGRGGGQGRDGRGMQMLLSDDELQTLSQGEPYDILVCVNQNESKFLNSFKYRHYCMHPLKLKRLIKLLYLLVKYKEEPETAVRILAHVLCADGEYALFMTQLDKLLKNMAFEERGYVRRENPAYISHLIDIGQMAIKKIPTTVVLTFPITVLQQTVQDLVDTGEKMDLISQKCEELSSEFRLIKVQAIKDQMAKKKSKSPKESEGEPPEPFTELSILPKLEEMNVDASKVFLRSNKTKGGYTNWEHYFDVQFRLLREDFVRPLRDGINQYCHKGSSKRPSEIRVYEGAKVLNPVCLFTGIAFQLRFDTSKLGRVNWEHSRRLIYGSLLCLSNDNFDQCFLFATVAKRDDKLLKEGMITVKFENGVNGFRIDPNESYTMVESTAYYEAYRHVLEGLQELSRIPDAMPMKKCIVDVNFSDVKVPAFLRVPMHPPRFAMAEILEKKDPSELKTRSLLPRKVFDITSHNLWPEAHCTHLDSSQLRALEMALTKEVSVIQGPPGTGKTYIGHKIVEAYLKNRAVWDPQKAAPILVVCYTNHALDQFLEGIHDLSVDGKSPDIIRVGGRCKSESLANCILSKKVQECRSNRSIPRHTFKGFMDAKTDLFDGQASINRNIESCDAQAQQKIIRLSNLKPVMMPLHVDQLMFGAETVSGKEIEVWLKLWFPDYLEYEDLPPPVNVQAEITHEEASLSDDEDLIEVDNEARVLEEGRMIEGEAIELPGWQQHDHSQDEYPVRSKKADKYGWQTVQLNEGQRKKLLSKGFKNTAMTDEDASGVRNIWMLNDKERWKLYLYWNNEYIKLCKERVNLMANAYNTSCDMYRQCQKNIDCFAANGADVIGMTTTGAAKYHHLLKSIHPKIVIFEEAAEVLEAHVITSLASSVQQLILIGDHKQLKPKPTCYALEKDYNLDVSLFERLIENGFDHVTLEKQHRMRPEVSKLICPIIYDKLLDADSVKKYDHVLGVGKDVFFIDHIQPEEANDYSDTRSHVNKHEADYIVELCLYLRKQGYAPYDITILTMYRGQLFELRKRMKREYFEGVRVAAVDDFQGEENEIILLSLVRSNSENSIGFLKIENRVCVSLSRAKRGLYVIGNLAMLRDKHETKWPAIIHHLEKEQAVGSALPLYCQVHKDDKIAARMPDDFRQRPEGGCTKVCNTRLPCGHACERICHPTDREHSLAKCSKVCSKTLPCGHNCRRKCYECKKRSMCAPCSLHVEKTLPHCGHKVILDCSADPALIPCPLPCDQTLPCGHHCQNTCSVPCTFQCKEKVTKQLPCGHATKVRCFEDPDIVTCPEKCEKELKCGDKCGGTCGKCQRGRLHVKCVKECGRDLVCGHPCKYPCASVCPPCEEKCNNYCIHSHCPKKCYELCAPCMEPCEWRCPHFKCTKPCGEPCDRPPCNKPCKKKLRCGHPCIGLCGENCPKQCRICDKEEVCEIIFGTEDEDDALFVELRDCGHILEVSGLDKWIETDTSTGSTSESNQLQVQFKTCPKCKTPIRKSLRYGHAIKETLRDVEAIKHKQIDIAGDLRLKYKEAQVELRDLGDTSYILQDFQSITEGLKSQDSTTSNWYRATATEFQLSLLPKLLKVYKIIETIPSSISASNCSQSYLQESLSVLKQFLMQEFLSSQQISDCVSELRRLTCATKLLDLLAKLQAKKCKVTRSDLSNIVSELERAYLSGWKRPAITEAEEGKVNELIRSMSTRYEVDGLSKEEKLKIVEAIGLSKGHWFKCPKGHYYCIGECGGAMESSKCPECGSTIGGQSHNLAPGNVHAGDLDGSQYAAWSDRANLANFDPADLARLRI